MGRQALNYLLAAAIAIVIGALLFFAFNHHESNAEPVAKQIATVIEEALRQDLPDTTIVIPNPNTLAISHEYEMPVIQVDNSRQHQSGISSFVESYLADTPDKPQPFNYAVERSKLERLHLHPFVRDDHLRKLEAVEAYRVRLQDNLNQPPKITHIEPAYAINVSRSLGFSTGNVTKYHYDNPIPPAIKITNTQTRDTRTQARDTQVAQLWVGDTYDIHNATFKYPLYIITIIQCNLSRIRYSPLNHKRSYHVELTQVDTDFTPEENLARARDLATQMAVQMFRDSGKF